MTIKPLLDQYAAYDAWANARFVDRLSREEEALLDAPATSSFPTLRATLLHMRDASNAWHGRLTGTRTTWPADDTRDIAGLVRYTTRFRDLVLATGEAALLDTVVYTDLRGREHAQPAWQMIMHCLNHGTYHRGQVVTQMRSLGLEEVPGTDLVVYQRSLPK